MTQSSDEITGSIGMSGPLNGESSAFAVGTMNLFLKLGSNAGNILEFPADVPGFGLSNTDIGNGFSATLRPFFVDDVYFPDPVQLTISPDVTSFPQSSDYIVRVQPEPSPTRIGKINVVNASAPPCGLSSLTTFIFPIRFS